MLKLHYTDDTLSLDEHTQLSLVKMGAKETFIKLPFYDPRGYTPVLATNLDLDIFKDRDVRLYNLVSGCRCYNIYEALDHWMPMNYIKNTLYHLDKFKESERYNISELNAMLKTYVEVSYLYYGTITKLINGDYEIKGYEWPRLIGV